jgi:hypothetical protein
MSQNQVISAPNSSAFKSSLFTKDSTDPEVAYFSLDMDGEGKLTIVLSEVVAVSSVKPESLLLARAKGNNSVSVSLDGSTVLSPADSLTIEVRPTDEIMNIIKSDELFASASDRVFLSISKESMKDMAGNTLKAITRDNALEIDLSKGNFTADTSKPQLSSFDFDVNNRLVDLVFTEIVDSSGFNASSLIFHNGSGVAGASHMLRNSTVKTSGLSKSVRVALGPGDEFSLKARFDLATGKNDTYLKMTSDGVSDRESNPSIEVLGLQVSTYTRDSTAPSLKGFLLDMNIGRIYLTFSEVMNYNTLITGNITLSSVNTISASTYILQYSSVPSQVISDIIQVNVPQKDIDQINLISGLAVDKQTSYVSLKNNSVADAASNPLSEISLQNSIEANRYVKDETRPLLKDFSLDMNAGSFEFTFSEVISALTFDLTQFTLQNTGTQAPSQSLTFSSSEASAKNGVTLLVNISDTD